MRIQLIRHKIWTEVKEMFSIHSSWSPSAALSFEFHYRTSDAKHQQSILAMNIANPTEENGASKVCILAHNQSIAGQPEHNHQSREQKMKISWSKPFLSPHTMAPIFGKPWIMSYQQKIFLKKCKEGCQDVLQLQQDHIQCILFMKLNSMPTDNFLTTKNHPKCLIIQGKLKR